MTPRRPDGPPAYVHQILPHAELLRHAAWSPDGSVAALAFDEPWLFLVDGADGSVRAKLAACATELRFADDGDHLMWTSCDGEEAVTMTLSDGRQATTPGPGAPKRAPDPSAFPESPPRLLSRDGGRALVREIAAPEQEDAKSGLHILHTATGTDIRLRTADSAWLPGGHSGHAHWDHARDRLIWSFERGDIETNAKYALSAGGRYEYSNLVVRALDTPRAAQRPLEDADTRDPKAFGVSPKGTYYLGVDGYEQGNDTRIRAALVIWTMADHRVWAKLPAGFGRASWTMTADERLVATTAWIPCPSEPACDQALVFDVAAKKRVRVVSALGGDLSNIAFSGDGHLLLLGSGVHGVRSGEVLFRTTGEGETIGGFLPKTTGSVIVTSAAGARIVDVDTGQERARIDGVDSLLDASEDGRRLLFSGRRRWLLYDVGTGVLQTLPLSWPERYGPRPFFATGRSIVVLPTSAGAELYRIGDGRMLYRYGIKSPMFVTGEGVFGGDAAAWSQGAFRMGGNVAKDRIAPVGELANRLHRKDLLAEFLDGSDVSPP